MDGYRGTTLRRVIWSRDLEAVRPLFVNYRRWLADHQDPARSARSRVAAGLAEIDRQISQLPGEFEPPRGDVILAAAENDIVALGALRELAPKLGEIKRIHVRADHRGPKFGPILTRALLERAGELGWERVRVDTLPTMEAAIQFYQDLGFRAIDAYWPHPSAGALFFECHLARRRRRPTAPSAHARGDST